MKYGGNLFELYNKNLIKILVKIEEKVDYQSAQEAWAGVLRGFHCQ